MYVPATGVIISLLPSGSPNLASWNQSAGEVEQWIAELYDGGIEGFLLDGGDLGYATESIDLAA